MSAPEDFKHKRKYVRYEPDPLSMAHIDLDPDRKTFEPALVGLITQEGFGGCGLVVRCESVEFLGLDIGVACRIKLGKLDPIGAHVAWHKQIAKDLLRIGFKFSNM